MLTEVQQARVDMYMDKARPVNVALADDYVSVESQKTGIDNAKAMYDQLDEDTQRHIRTEIMPHQRWGFDTGWDKCDKCIQGMISPEAPKLDKPITRVIGGEEIVIEEGMAEKIACPNCGGTGEIKRTAGEN